MHKSRLKTLVTLVFSMIQFKTVQLSELALGFSGSATIASSIRRCQRFMQQQYLSQLQLATLVLEVFGCCDTPLTLVMDRTNWRFGNTPINVLLIGFLYQGTLIPLMWEQLDREGTSDTALRKRLLKRVFEVVPPSSIQYLLADREFVGKDWFAFLRDAKIPFCIRLKANIHLTLANGKNAPLSMVFRRKQSEEGAMVSGTLWGVTMHLYGKRVGKDEWLFLTIPPGVPLEAPTLYRQRWSIECLFKALKTNGFHWESTHLKHADRLDCLMGVMVLAYAWSVKIGVLAAERSPIPIKAHGRKAYSVFHYGLRLVRRLLTTAFDAAIDLLVEMIRIIHTKQSLSSKAIAILNKG